MKVEHVSVNGVVHRLITSSNGARTISCDLEFDDPEFDENDMLYTEHHLTCVQCAVRDWHAVGWKVLGTRSGRISSREKNP